MTFFVIQIILANLIILFQKEKTYSNMWTPALFEEVKVVCVCLFPLVYVNKVLFRSREKKVFPSWAYKIRVCVCSPLVYVNKGLFRLGGKKVFPPWAYKFCVCVSVPPLVCKWPSDFIRTFNHLYISGNVSVFKLVHFWAFWNTPSILSPPSDQLLTTTY